MKPAPPHVDVASDGELIFVCPLCEDRSGHMRLDPDKGVWYCYRHGEGGSIASLRKRTGIEWPLNKDASKYRRSDRERAKTELNKAFELAGVPSPFDKKTKLPPVDYERLTNTPYVISDAASRKGGLGASALLLSVYELGRAWYEAPEETPLPPPPWGPAVRAAWYARSRGLSFDEAEALSLRVAGDPTAIGKKLSYFGRLVFPFFNPENGRLRSFQARDVFGYAKQKYLGPKAPPAGTIIFYAPKAYTAAACRLLRRPVLVEGVLDAVAVNRAGFPAVAVCGKRLSPEQFTELEAFGMREAFVMFDSEPEAQTKARAVCGGLLSKGIAAYHVPLDEGDPGACSPEQIRELLGNVEAVTGISQMADAIKGPAGSLLKRDAKKDEKSTGGVTPSGL